MDITEMVKALISSDLPPSLADSANLNFTYSYDDASRLTSRSVPNGVIEQLHLGFDK